MTNEGICLRLREMAEAHWMLARQPGTWRAEALEHERDAALLEHAADRLEAALPA